MTIEDELLVELLKPDIYGNVGKEALIIRVVGSRKIDYLLEELFYYQDKTDAFQRTWSKMSPDIVVNKQEERIAIEVENDVQWDFQASLRQVKKYRAEFSDIRLIIPEDYVRFAPLYKKEGFRVWLWSARRRWRCEKCETVTETKGRVAPPYECKNTKCRNKNGQDFTLIGLVDADIREFPYLPTPPAP